MPDRAVDEVEWHGKSFNFLSTRLDRGWGCQVSSLLSSLALLLHLAPLRGSIFSATYKWGQDGGRGRGREGEAELLPAAISAKRSPLPSLPTQLFYFSSNKSIKVVRVFPPDGSTSNSTSSARLIRRESILHVRESIGRHGVKSPRHSPSRMRIRRRGGIEHFFLQNLNVLFSQLPCVLRAVVRFRMPSCPVPSSRTGFSV